MKTYLAFDGNEGTTTGTPHASTGRMSIFGNLYSFTSKQDRDEFCNEYSNRFNSYPKATNKREAKSRFFAGISQTAFEEHLSYSDLSW